MAKTSIALWWTQGKASIVPEGHADAERLFAPEGKELAPSVIQRFGLTDYMGERKRRTRKRSAEVDPEEVEDSFE